ncbi:hypothetical protein LP416_14630 [Polaromonas sp. P2-4]|nr:hypothetical protein LP416_14630 [Polaromonas sp. P2-4]
MAVTIPDPFRLAHPAVREFGDDPTRAAEVIAGEQSSLPARTVVADREPRSVAAKPDGHHRRHAALSTWLPHAMGFK